MLIDEKQAARRLIQAQERFLPAIEEKRLTPMMPEDLMQAIGYTDGSEMFEQDLALLLAHGSLVKTRKNKIGLPAHLGLVPGRIQGNARGFAFLVPDDREREMDVFLPSGALMGALHGDRVLVRVTGHSRRNGKESREGEVARVLVRANPRIVGRFDRPQESAFVVPDDVRISKHIHIPHRHTHNAKPGDKVVVEVTMWPDDARVPDGRVIEIIGHVDQPGTDVRSIIRMFDLPEEFPAGVKAAAKRVPQQVGEEDLKGREDFRDEMIFTIDGEDAKDFDDAVSIQALDPGTYRLGVYIADVSHYVKENAALDKEALERGTSVYLVDRVIPMLPFELSNGICSLNEGVDRLVLACIADIGADGQILSYRLSEGVIRSKHRMTYNKVYAIMQNDPELCKQYVDIVPHVRHMQQLMKILQHKRVARGAVDFDVPEAEIILDEKGVAIDIEKRERNDAHRMIEEFMLAANEMVAGYLKKKKSPALFRVHESPDAEKMQDFSMFVGAQGFRLREPITPKVLQDLLRQVKGHAEEGIISRLMLRSMMKARYSEQDLGHFGLAARDYCHFTSPIRRYPDLVVHRLVRQNLRGQMNKARRERWIKRLPDIAEQTSLCERKAMDAERAADDRKKAEYMLSHIGEEFEGTVSGVSGYGFYVELPNTIEGLVHISTLDDDYYVYDEAHYRLIGQHTHRVFRLGDKVRVRASKADIESHNVDFVLAEKEE